MFSCATWSTKRASVRNGDGGEGRDTRREEKDIAGDRLKEWVLEEKKEGKKRRMRRRKGTRGRKGWSQERKTHKGQSVLRRGCQLVTFLRGETTPQDPAVAAAKAHVLVGLPFSFGQGGSLWLLVLRSRRRPLVSQLSAFAKSELVSYSHFAVSFSPFAGQLSRLETTSCLLSFVARRPF